MSHKSKGPSLIDKVKVRPGRIIKVYNTDRKKFSNAKLWYNAIWVENAKGKNERCLLFTEKELERAEHRAKMNKEDLTKKEFFTNLLD